jgi:hypothetical protein
LIYVGNYNLESTFRFLLIIWLRNQPLVNFFIYMFHFNNYSFEWFFMWLVTFFDYLWDLWFDHNFLFNPFWVCKLLRCFKEYIITIKFGVKHAVKKILYCSFSLSPFTFYSSLLIILVVYFYNFNLVNFAKDETNQCYVDSQLKTMVNINIKSLHMDYYTLILTLVAYALVLTSNLSSKIFSVTQWSSLAK